MVFDYYQLSPQERRQFDRELKWCFRNCAPCNDTKHRFALSH